MHILETALTVSEKVIKYLAHNTYPVKMYWMNYDILVYNTQELANTDMLVQKLISQTIWLFC